MFGSFHFSWYCGLEIGHVKGPNLNLFGAERLKNLIMDFDSFFSRICQDLDRDGKVREISNQFSTCSNDNQRVAFVRSLEAVTIGLREQLSLLEEERVSFGKSLMEADRLRAEGNSYYSRKLNTQAIRCYNQSVLLATGEQLALAYANRSAVLHDLGDWLYCLRDIQLAFDTGYPTHLEHKLHERRGNCWLMLEEKSLAYDSFLAATKSFSIPVDKLAILSSKMKQLAGSCSDVTPRTQAVPTPVGRLEERIHQMRSKAPELNGIKANPLIPVASASIRMTQSAERGRCLIAVEPLEPGKSPMNI